MSDLTNIGNPQNNRHDWEEQNAPHVTPIPEEATADDLYDDSVEERLEPELSREIPGPLPGQPNDATSWNH